MYQPVRESILKLPQFFMNIFAVLSGLIIKFARCINHQKKKVIVRSLYACILHFQTILNCFLSHEGMSTFKIVLLDTPLLIFKIWILESLYFSSLDLSCQYIKKEVRNISVPKCGIFQVGTFQSVSDFIRLMT